MNLDGSITISDVWLWIKWLYFYPGDGLVYFLFHKAPSIASFFEMTPSSYGGVFSGMVSFIFFGIFSVIATSRLVDFWGNHDSDDMVSLFIFGAVVFIAVTLFITIT